MSRSWPGAVLYPFAAVSDHVRLSPWARAAMTEEDRAELERLASEKDTTVAIVKRRDGKWAGRVDGHGVVLSATPYGAGRLALEGMDCE